MLFTIFKCWRDERLDLAEHVHEVRPKVEIMSPGRDKLDDRELPETAIPFQPYHPSRLAESSIKSL